MIINKVFIDGEWRVGEPIVGAPFKTELGRVTISGESYEPTKIDPYKTAAIEKIKNECFDRIESMSWLKTRDLDNGVDPVEAEESARTRRVDMREASNAAEAMVLSLESAEDIRKFTW